MAAHHLVLAPAASSSTLTGVFRGVCMSPTPVLYFHPPPPPLAHSTSLGLRTNPSAWVLSSATWILLLITPQYLCLSIPPLPFPSSAAMTYHSTLKTRLAAGNPLYGAFLCSFSSALAELLGYCGFDYVVVDMEHGPGDVCAALPCLQALKAAGTFSILRIPANDPTLAKKALDLGPDGIMIPMVETAEEAEMAVAACRYPPKGVRGAASGLIRASRYGLDLDYSRKVEDDLLVMLQIESKKGVENVTQIASVEGVGCLMMGPRDLSSSLGYLDDPAGDAVVEKLLHRAEAAVLKAGINKGLYLAGIARAKDVPTSMYDRGYHMVAGAVDLSLFRDAALANLRKFKPMRSF